MVANDYIGILKGPRAIPRLWAGIVLLWACCARSPTAMADPLWPEDRMLLSIGLRLFPACLAADTELAGRIDPAGRLRVLVLHPDSPEVAAEVVDELRRIGKVRGIPLQVGTITPGPLFDLPEQSLAAVFVAAPGIDTALFEEAVRRQTLLFSPFPGDVERGAVAGVRITDQILPHVNLSQAERAGVRFKEFFLRAAKHHE